MSDTLTKGQQKEIVNYIRDRAAGIDPDIEKLPMWLAELETLRRSKLITPPISEGVKDKVTFLKAVELVALNMSERRKKIPATSQAAEELHKYTVALLIILYQADALVRTTGDNWDVGLETLAKELGLAFPEK